MLSILQNTAAGNTNTLLLATTATAAAVLLTARQKKLRLVQKWLLAAVLRRRQKKGNGIALLLGFLTLLLGIAALIGIIYFAAIGNYLMVLVSTGIVLAIVFIVAYGGSKSMALRSSEKSER